MYLHFLLCAKTFFLSRRVPSRALLCAELCRYLDTIKDVRRLWTCFQTISPWKYLGRHGNVVFFPLPSPPIFVICKQLATPDTAD